MVTLGIAGAPYTVNCSFPAANSEGETPAAASAAVIFKKSRLFSSIFQSPYRICLKYKCTFAHLLNTDKF